MKTKAVFSMFVILMSSATAFASDSPHFRGLNRDGVYPESGLLKSWPDDGPAVAWSAKGIGEGYSSPSIVGDTIYVSGQREDGQGVLNLLNLDGTPKGAIPYGPETKERQATGPRSTPTIDGDRAYVMSGFGVVTCFDLKKGEVSWQIDVMKRFGSEVVKWSMAESLYVDDKLVYCSPGAEDASIVALDKSTGDTVWTSKGLSDQNGYCTPDIIEHNGRKILLSMTAFNVVGIDPENGTLLWQHPHPTDYDIHAVTPVYADGMIYYVGGYESGGGMLELSEDGSSITPKWTDLTLESLHHGVVLIDGYIYGAAHSHGLMVCLELKTGKVMWKTEEIQEAAVVAADGMIYLYEGPKKGVVNLVEATPEGFNRTGQFEFTEGGGKHWAHPTIANGRMYIRHGDALVAYNVKAE